MSGAQDAHSMRSFDLIFVLKSGTSLRFSGILRTVSSEGTE
jgi:hypothetical protein